METEQEFLKRILSELQGHCEFWACAGSDKPFESMATCYVCSTVQEIRARMDTLKGIA